MGEKRRETREGEGRGRERQGFSKKSVIDELVGGGGRAAEIKLNGSRQLVQSTGAKLYGCDRAGGRARS